MSTLKPRIYAVCLTAYYKWHRVYGEWINATQSVPDMEKEILDMLIGSPVPSISDDTISDFAFLREKWAIHCTQDFGTHIVRSNDDLYTISEKATFIVENGQRGMNILDSQEGNLEWANRFLGRNEVTVDHLDNFVF